MAIAPFWIQFRANEPRKGNNRNAAASRNSLSAIWDSRAGKAHSSEPFRIVEQYCTSIIVLGNGSYVHSFEYVPAVIPVDRRTTVGAETTTQACAMGPSTGTERHELTAQLRGIPGVGEMFPVSHEVSAQSV